MLPRLPQAPSPTQLRDHTDAGLFLYGPMLAINVRWLLMMAQSPEWTRYLESPTEARARTRAKRREAKRKARQTERFLRAAYRGEHIRNRRAA